jgi:hypothetical protein
MDIVAGEEGVAVVAQGVRILMHPIINTNSIPRQFLRLLTRKLTSKIEFE